MRSRGGLKQQGKGDVQRRGEREDEQAREEEEEKPEKSVCRAVTVVEHQLQRDPAEGRSSFGLRWLGKGDGAAAFGLLDGEFTRDQMAL